MYMEARSAARAQISANAYSEERGTLYPRPLISTTQKMNREIV